MPCERRHVEAMEAAFWELVYAPESQPKLDAVVDARDAAYAACDESPWRSMESAPKDGRPVLLSVGDGEDAHVEASTFIEGDWLSDCPGCVYIAEQIRAWMPMPLPAAPEEKVNTTTAGGGGEKGTL